MLLAIYREPVAWTKARLIQAVRDRIKRNKTKAYYLRGEQMYAEIDPSVRTGVIRHYATVEAAQAAQSQNKEQPNG